MKHSILTIAGLTVLSCTGFEELNDPNEFAAYSVKMEEVQVSKSDLEITLSADLEMGGSTKGSGSFLVSKDSNMSEANEISADRQNNKLTASCVLLGYGETYYVKAVFKGGKSSLESSSASFSLYGFDDYVSVEKPTCISIKQTEVSITANVKVAKGISLNESGFELSKSSEPFLPSASATASISSGTINARFSNLEAARNYYARAYVKDGKNIVYSETIALTTEPAQPSLGIPDVSNVTKNSALVTTTLVSNGGAEVSEMGVVYSLTKSPTVASAKVKASSTDTGVFSVNITGLDPGKTYFARAYAVNSVGTAYSSEVSFTTGLDEAKLTTSSVSGITSNSAVCGGSISSDGGAPVTARGVVWSTSQNPTVSLSSKTINGSGTGQFTSTITGLKPVTTYYVRAYATTLAGTAYGNEVSFTTNATVPTVSTQTISNITTVSAMSGGNVTNDGGAAVTARGVIWSISPEPMVTLSSKTIDGAGTGKFSSSITNLKPGMTYYVRAYATNEEGTAYGEQVTLITPSDYTGHEYVDLGLPSRLKWAACNVGATKAEDPGALYQWGGINDVSSRRFEITWYDCPYLVNIDNEGVTKWSKYVPSDKQSFWSGEGLPDNKTTLDLVDDAANIDMMGSWRMPTKDEWAELIGNCTWEWTDSYNQTGVSGYIITSNIEGFTTKYIFLPTNGWDTGEYWSSSLYLKFPHSAYIMYMSKNYSISYTLTGNRFRGYLVRAVSK